MATLRLGDTAPNFIADSSMGTIDLYNYLGDGWGILFSHPADFTPVCTTELGTASKFKGEFDKRNVKMLALSVDGADSHKEWIKDIQEAMKRISKRLGLERYKIVCTLFEDAVDEQMKNNSFHLYKVWIAYLLKEYYDPMYDYQIQKNASRILFRGNSEEIISYIQNHPIDFL